jgi:hypothetical protein
MKRIQVLVIFAGLFVIGCGESTPPPYDEKTLKAADQFSKIAGAYKEAYQRNGRPPASAEELKPFLKKHGEPNALLTSQLDGKPVVVIPGPAPNTPPEEGESAIIAYEQTGVGGKRMTVDSRGTIVFVSEAEFARTKFAGGHKPR